MTQSVNYYGVDGQSIGTYQFNIVLIQNVEPELTSSVVSLNVYFSRKRVGTIANGATNAFLSDRLGSNGSYYPYGEVRGTVPQNDVGFATYLNDVATALQYADQRFYASNFGRFMSPDDPYKASAGVKDPGSWNRYSYTRNDPVNRFDPSGRWDCDPEDDNCVPCPDPTEGIEDPNDPGDCGEGGGGGDTASPLTCQFNGATIYEPGWGTVALGYGFHLLLSSTLQRPAETGRMSGQLPNW